MSARAWLSLGGASLLLSGCVRTVTWVEERRDRPVEHSTFTRAPRAWQATLSPIEGGAHLSLWSHATCTRRLVVTVKRTRVTESRGERGERPQPDASETVDQPAGPCDRRRAPRTKLIVTGPPDAEPVTVETDEDGAATVPFTPTEIGRVVTGDGAEVKTLVGPGASAESAAPRP